MTANPTPSLYKLDRPLTLPQVIDELAVMPGRLRREIGAITARSLTRRPAPDDWSSFETLCHFRDAALVYAIRFRHIIFDDDPFLPNYDENNWVAASRDTAGDVAAILDEIDASRAGLVSVLSRLPGEGWLRSGRHEVMGRVVLEDYARHQVVHEEMHLAQIRAAATQ